MQDWKLQEQLKRYLRAEFKSIKAYSKFSIQKIMNHAAFSSKVHPH